MVEVSHSPKPIIDSVVDTVVSWANNRSKDPKMKVGAGVYTFDGNLFLGYNGFPSNVDDVKTWWEETDKAWNKHDFVIHAEVNAILKAVKSNSSLDSSFMVVTLFPCVNCIKMAAAAGISKIIYVDDKDCSFKVTAQAAHMNISLVNYSPWEDKDQTHA